MTLTQTNSFSLFCAVSMCCDHSLSLSFVFVSLQREKELFRDTSESTQYALAKMSQELTQLTKDIGDTQWSLRSIYQYFHKVSGERERDHDR